MEKDRKTSRLPIEGRLVCSLIQIGQDVDAGIKTQCGAVQCDVVIVSVAPDGIGVLLVVSFAALVLIGNALGGCVFPFAEKIT